MKILLIASGYSDFDGPREQKGSPYRRFLVYLLVSAEILLAADLMILERHDREQESYERAK